MKLPNSAPTARRAASDFRRPTTGGSGLQPQGCNAFEWVGCAAAVAGCAAFSGPALIACVAAAAPGCVKCVT